MNDNYQSGKTQAIDLDELHVKTANRPPEMQVRGEFELDKWSDDPWASTEESRKKRRWADDERWFGDNEEKNAQPEKIWETDEESLKAGWHAPKRGDELIASEGWDDWDNFGGAPKELEQEQESKDFGGYRRVQAASQYAQVDTSNYADGRAQRDDLYRSKEAFGTSGVRERKGDPYADIMQREVVPVPEMKPVSVWDDDVPDKTNKPVNDEEDMRASAKISNLAQGGDDIPGVARASIIIFQAETEPVVFELKKITTSIGRGLDNMVILNDQFASRHHLTIKYVGGRFELFALSIDNMASVNGYPISHIVLKNNDQIEVGATRIKFVLGPISDEQMRLTAPTNGRPVHLDPPPQEMRSPKTTRKNLILLIAVVSVIVFFMIAGLVIMAVTKVDTPPEVVSSADQADDLEMENAQDEEPVVVEKEKIKLSNTEKSLLDGMIEAYGLTVSNYHSTNSSVVGEHAEIKLESTPEGARIYNSDGSLRGTTPYKISEKYIGDYKETWTVRKDGYLDQKVDIIYSESVSKKVELESEVKEEVKPEVPEPAAAPVKRKPKPRPRPRPRHDDDDDEGSSGRIQI